MANYLSGRIGALPTHFWSCFLPSPPPSLSRRVSHLIFFQLHSSLLYIPHISIITLDCSHSNFSVRVFMPCSKKRAPALRNQDDGFRAHDILTEAMMNMVTEKRSTATPCYQRQVESNPLQILNHSKRTVPRRWLLYLLLAKMLQGSVYPS